MRLAAVVLLCWAASGCTEVIAATSSPECGPKMAAVRTTYDAVMKGGDAVGSAMGMARTMQRMEDDHRDRERSNRIRSGTNSVYGSPRDRRAAREAQRAGREHSRNMAALQRAATAYSAATKVCWFVPPLPVGAARLIY